MATTKKKTSSEPIVKEIPGEDKFFTIDVFRLCGIDKRTYDLEETELDDDDEHRVRIVFHHDC